MRVIVVKDRTSLQTLTTTLLGEKADKDVLARLQKLNPHVDIKKLEPGTILLVPPDIGAREGDTSPVQGEAFASLRAELTSSVEAARARVRTGFEAQAAQRTDVQAALKLAAVRRAIESDPELKAQVDQSAEVFKQDQANAKASEEMLKTMQAEAMGELDALAKLLG